MAATNDAPPAVGAKVALVADADELGGADVRVADGAARVCVRGQRVSGEELAGRERRGAAHHLPSHFSQVRPMADGGAWKSVSL